MINMWYHGMKLQTLLVQLIPNCTANHGITYTNSLMNFGLLITRQHFPYNSKKTLCLLGYPVGLAQKVLNTARLHCLKRIC